MLQLLHTLPTLCVFTMIFSTYSCTATQPSSAEEFFTNIYLTHWGSSGSGSYLNNVRPYISFLQKFLRDNEIKSVVDVGCGDWQFSQHIDWSGITYVGYDVVKYILEKNEQSFAGPTIQFIHANAIEEDLPSADLLICKDVLQHLSSEDIQRLIKQLHKFKHCLITNDILEKHIAINPELPRNSCPCRRLDLMKAPFNLGGTYIFNWNSEGWPKYVLHIRPDKDLLF